MISAMSRWLHSYIILYTHAPEMRVNILYNTCQAIAAGLRGPGIQKFTVTNVRVTGVPECPLGTKLNKLEVRVVT